MTVSTPGDVALGVAVTIATTWWAAPRFAVVCDRRVARRRLRGHGIGHTVDAVAAAPTDSPHVPTRSAPDTLRAIARALRAGATASEAVQNTVTAARPPSPRWDVIATELSRGALFEAALDRALRPDDPNGHDGPRTRTALGDDGTAMLRCAHVDGILSAPALERAADAIDDSDAQHDEVRIAVAHARQTARILTGLPVVVAVAAFALSPAVRESWRGPGVALPLAVGAFLNMAGRLAISRSIARVLPRTIPGADDPASVADELAVMLSAGLTPAAACRRIGTLPLAGPAAREVSRGVLEGRPLREALVPFARTDDSANIAESLIAAARDGVAASGTIARLADDARRVRRTRTREATAALPARLAVPVTTLVLPSFLVGAVAPLVVAGVSSMGGARIGDRSDVAVGTGAASTPAACTTSGESCAD